MKIDDLGTSGASHMEVTGGGIAASYAQTKPSRRVASNHHRSHDCRPDGITIPEFDSTGQMNWARPTRGQMLQFWARPTCTLDAKVFLDERCLSSGLGPPAFLT